jgi:hypothetical protein
MGNWISKRTTAKKFLVNAINRAIQEKIKTETIQASILQFCTFNTRQYVTALAKSNKLSWAPSLIEGLSLWKIIAKEFEYLYWECDNVLDALPRDAKFNVELCSIAMHGEVFTGFIRSLPLFLHHYPSLISCAFKMHDAVADGRSTNAVGMSTNAVSHGTKDWIQYNGPWKHHLWRDDAKKILADNTVITTDYDFEHHKIIKFSTCDLILSKCRIWNRLDESTQFQIFDLMPRDKLQDAFDHSYHDVETLEFDCMLINYVCQRPHEFNDVSFKRKHPELCDNNELKRYRDQLLKLHESQGRYKHQVCVVLLPFLHLNPLCHLIVDYIKP